MPIELHNQIQAQRTNALARELAQIPFAGTFTLEIGCGHGHFLTAYAAAHPDTTCIGIDLLKDRLQRAARKTTAQNLPNAHWLQADATLFLNQLPATVRPTQIYILFPDPWPKRRHHKNRLIQLPFLELLAQKSTPGTSTLHFRTDHSDYYHAALETLQASPHWQLLDTPFPFEHETVFQQKSQHHHSLSALAKPARSNSH